MPTLVLWQKKKTADIEMDKQKNLGPPGASENLAIFLPLPLVIFVFLCQPPSLKTAELEHGFG